MTVKHLYKNAKRPIPNMNTLYSKLLNTVKRSSLITDTLSIEEANAFLTRNKPTKHNETELLHALGVTREDRRKWITEEHPSITEILKKYPRFGDMTDAIKQEFSAICLSYTDRQLCNEWIKVENNIMKLASKLPTKPQILLDMDENNPANVTKTAILLLPHLLPSIPKKGHKAPRMGPDARATVMIFSLEDGFSVEEAVTKAQCLGMKQPGLLCLGQSYYLKLDMTLVEVKDVANIIEAIEVLFMCFFVFDVEYPQELNLIYKYFETLCGLNSHHYVKSSVLRNFLSSVKNIPSACD